MKTGFKGRENALWAMSIYVSTPLKACDLEYRGGEMYGGRFLKWLPAFAMLRMTLALPKLPVYDRSWMTHGWICNPPWAEFETCSYIMVSRSRCTSVHAKLNGAVFSPGLE